MTRNSEEEAEGAEVRVPERPRRLLTKRRHPPLPPRSPPQSPEPLRIGKFNKPTPRSTANSITESYTRDSATRETTSPR